MEPDGSHILILIPILIAILTVRALVCGGCRKSDAKIRAAAAILKFIIDAAVAVLIYVFLAEPLGKILGGALAGLGIEKTAAYAIGSVVCCVAVILAAAVLIDALCEEFPSKTAESSFQENTLIAARKALSPWAALSLGIAGIAGKLFHTPEKSPYETVTEEKILSMVDAGGENGSLDENECEMINKIFEFGDLKVSDVMTHRTDLAAVEKDTAISGIVKLAIDSGRSRIPVYDKDIDRIIGIINVKDLLCLVGCEEIGKYSVSDFVRDVIFVPESAKLDEVFERLTENKAQLAVAIDEYGGTAGIVTIEDMTEVILGNIQDEYDDEPEEVVEVSENVYMIDGTAPPQEVFELLGLTHPEAEEDYDTMSGFFIDLLGRIPQENETPTVIYENAEFTALLTEDMRVSEIKAVIKEEQPIGNKE